MDKIKTLSQAIRVGSTIRPQCYGNFFEEVAINGQFVIGSCALGAAAEAIGMNPEDPNTLNTISTQALHNRFHELDIKVKFRNSGERLETLIPHLNDDLRWTRESIADWVDEQERVCKSCYSE